MMRGGEADEHCKYYFKYYSNTTPEYTTNTRAEYTLNTCPEYMYSNRRIRVKIRVEFTSSVACCRGRPCAPAPVDC